MVVASIAMSLAAFFWAIRTGQFSDQTRARYLPLVDSLSMTEPVKDSKWVLPVCALSAILGIGLVAMLVIVFLVLSR